MPKAVKLNVVYSDISLENAISIKAYLSKQFSEKELKAFIKLLHTFEEAVSIFPKLYPQTKHKSKVRRAVLSRELSAFYRIGKSQIEVMALFDNRCDISNWL